MKAIKNLEKILLASFLATSISCSSKIIKQKTYFENKEKIIYILEHSGSRFYLVDIGKDGKIDGIYKDGKKLPPSEVKKYMYLKNYIK